MSIYYIIVAVISFSLSLLLLRKVVSYAYSKQIFDTHDGRKIHHGNIPRVGGIAFVPSIFISCLLIFLLLYLKDFTFDNTKYANLLISLILITFMYFFGVLDDIKGITYRTKFSYQILIGLFISIGGLSLSHLNGLIGLYEIPPAFGCLLTTFLVVLVINAYNFIDGIDGLSSGIAILSLIYYSVILWINDNILFILSIATLFAVIPFFYFNMFGTEKKKNKTFMGDTGSTILGFILLIIAIVVTNDVKETGFFSKSLLIGFTPLLVPCCDVVNVVLYRLIHGKSPFKADKNHFHHKLLKLGFSQHKTLVIELSIIVTISILTIALSQFVNVNIILFIFLFFWLWLNYMLTNKVKKRDIN